MSATQRIFIRVTKNQYERVRNNAQASGFVTVSSYIRSLTLENGLSFQRKFNELYDKVVNGSKTEESMQDRRLSEWV